VKDQGKEEHLKHLPKVLGYGIGLNKKEDQLSIKEGNDRVIEKGMVFNVRLSLANFDSRPNRNCLLIADTVLAKESVDGSPSYDILTRGNPKNYGDISYSIDENDDDVPEGDEK
jgi:nucleosome binding factor SPN SPT16 subunit